MNEYFQCIHCDHVEPSGSKKPSADLPSKCPSCCKLTAWTFHSSAPEILASVDSENTDLPICPWCGMVEQCWWETNTLRNDGDTDEWLCGNCGYTYSIKIHVHYFFTTGRSDDR